MKKLKGLVLDGMFFTFAEYAVYESEYCESDDQESYRYSALQSMPCFDPELHEDYTDAYFDEWYEVVPDEFK